MANKWFGLLRRAAAFALTAAVLTAPALAAEITGEVVPVGRAVGIALETQGILVVATGEVQTAEGPVAPAKDAGLRPGDVITAADGTSVGSWEELSGLLETSGGEGTTLTVIRSGSEKTVTLAPAVNEQGSFEYGMCLRDGMSGIGTVTFYDPDSGIFGALGHPVSDVDTGATMPLRDGSVISAVITDVVPGEVGTPGQLVGSFDPADVIGTLTGNGPCGIFGYLEDHSDAVRDAVPIAGEGDVSTGEATILSNISGDTVEEYSAEITRLYSGDEAGGRSMMIRITDPRLLETTGGIVQGMSGSPVIQNGMLVGAVTHVLVDDPTRGYCVGIQEMLAEAAPLLLMAA